MIINEETISFFKIIFIGIPALIIIARCIFLTFKNQHELEKTRELIKWDSKKVKKQIDKYNKRSK